MRKQEEINNKRRADLYALLARFYQREADTAWLKKLAVLRFPEAEKGNELQEGCALLEAFLREQGIASAEPGAASGESVSGAEQSAASGDIEELLAVDYARIFLAAGIAEGDAAFPYESVYTGKKRLMMQEAWTAVRNIYRGQGLGLADLADGYEDHIGCELEFMSYLCRQEDADAPARQLAFLREHLLNWVLAFTADVEGYAQTDFYRAAARMTRGFLQEDEALLAELAAVKGELTAEGERTPESVQTEEGVSTAESVWTPESVPAGEGDRSAESGQTPEDVAVDAGRSFRVSRDKMNEVLQELQKQYQIYAPKLFLTGAGESGQTVRYARVTSLDEIEARRQSDFSPKEAYYPVSQTMFFFTEDEVMESRLEDEKGILVFARPCDIHAMKRLDNIFLKNGGQADAYYARLRQKVKLVMLECRESFEHCFCVSLGTNRADGYAAAVRIGGEEVLVQVKDAGFAELFGGEEASDFTPEFVTENRRKLRVPDIPDRETLKMASELDYWEQFNDNCIGCGGCNTVCGTCSCFDTVDIIYHEGSKEGERKRVWSSCMLEDFTQTAGGARARKTPGANMRFKVFHKFYDYKARFGEDHMCVGCGRCTKRCPQDIDFFETVNGLADILEDSRKRG